MLKKTFTFLNNPHYTYNMNNSCPSLSQDGKRKTKKKKSGGLNVMGSVLLKQQLSLVSR